jgi:hypothetical protein
VAEDLANLIEAYHPKSKQSLTMIKSIMNNTTSPEATLREATTWTASDLGSSRVDLVQLPING